MNWTFKNIFSIFLSAKPNELFFFKALGVPEWDIFSGTLFTLLICRKYQGYSKGYLGKKPGSEGL